MAESWLTVLLSLALIGAAANTFFTAAAWYLLLRTRDRVSRLESQQATDLSHAEVRGIYERLSSVEGRLDTTNSLLGAIQKHLLEERR